MKSKQNTTPRATGFTLVELLVVVTILAIVASIVVTQYGTTQKTSAEKVSIANQEAVNRTVQAYLMLNEGGKLNYLDTLVDWGTPAGAAGAVNTNLNSRTVVGGVYRGVKQASFGDASPPSISTLEHNSGITDGLASKLCVYYLKASDVSALAKIGLKRGVYFNYTGLHASSRGGLTVTSEMEIVNGGPAFRMDHAPAFGEALALGSPVLAITPSLANLSIYKNFGVPLKGSTGLDPQTDAEAITAASSKMLLVFGLGQNASIVGARNGGVEAAPRSETLNYSYYRNYLLVFRMMSGASAMNAGVEFAGVLDPNGQTVTDARHANEWRNGDR